MSDKAGLVYSKGYAVDISKPRISHLLNFSMKNNFIIILVTCASKKEARLIVDALIAKRLIACANIISGVESLFRWKGKVKKAREILLVLKTEETKFRGTESAIKLIHSYDLPEIIAVPVVAGNNHYLKWVSDSLKGKVGR